MKNTAKPLEESTKEWADDYLNGRWSQLLQYTAVGLAGLRARALLMQGQIAEAKQLLVQNKDSKAPWNVVNSFICLSHIEFVAGNFEAALFYANKAYLCAKKKGPSALRVDAGFYRALCLTQIGEKYQALSLYSQLRKLKNITNYRQDLIITNEAWLLWDLGLIEPLKEIVHLIPNPFGARIQMMVDFLTVGEGARQSYLSKLSMYNEFPQIEKENIFLILTEALLVYGQPHELESFQKSLFYSEVSHATNSDLIKFVLCLLKGEAPNQQLQGRDLVDGTFIKTLILKQDALTVYSNELLPLMKKEKFHSSFIPTLSQLKSPRNSWEKALRAKLYKIKSVGRIDLIESTKSLSLKGQQISFSKSPTSWKLVKAFEVKSRFKKEEIHFLLTGNKYRSDLHDTRIFKLIQRMNLKAKKLFGFEICRFDRANELEVLCEFCQEQS